MTAAQQEEEMVQCPVCRLFSELENAYGKKSTFFKHITQSRVELLKAFKSLIDERIEDLEKKSESKPKKKATKIKVE